MKSVEVMYALKNSKAAVEAAIRTSGYQERETTMAALAALQDSIAMLAQLVLQSQEAPKDR